MKLQTQIPFKKESTNIIDYNSKIVLLGSCFSENIGEKLDYYKLSTIVNPFGILFHPKAIEKLISNSINKKIYSSEDLVFQNERYHSFDAHSSLSAADEKKVLHQLNSKILSTNIKLKEASHIIITLGTSWVYRFIETDKIVANCHKIPQQHFAKEILSITEITESLESTLDLVKSINENATVIFTVSPVRHLKDGFTENTQSKAHLIAAIHHLITSNTKNINYFPSYEIMMDELRDYRFYSEDMIHPNKTAITYIWEKFITTWFSDQTIATMAEIEAIQKGISHNPLMKNQKNIKLSKKIIRKKERITQEFPFIKF